MKKIIAQLTANNKDLRNSRGGRLAKSLFLAFDTSVVRKLKTEVMELEGRLEDITDLGRTNVNQLDTNTKSDTAEKWALDVQSIAVKLELKKAELAVAEDLSKKLFGTEAEFDKAVAKFTEGDED